MEKEHKCDKKLGSKEDTVRPNKEEAGREGRKKTRPPENQIRRKQLVGQRVNEQWGKTSNS